MWPDQETARAVKQWKAAIFGQSLIDIFEDDRRRAKGEEGWPEADVVVIDYTIRPYYGDVRTRR